MSGRQKEVKRNPLRFTVLLPSLALSLQAPYKLAAERREAGTGVFRIGLLRARFSLVELLREVGLGLTRAYV